MGSQLEIGSLLWRKGLLMPAFSFILVKNMGKMLGGSAWSFRVERIR